MLGTTENMRIIQAIINMTVTLNINMTAILNINVSVIKKSSVSLNKNFHHC